MLSRNQAANPNSGSNPGTQSLELVVFAPDETRTHDLPAAGEVTLGRAEDNRIRLDHPSVSRHHARLTLGQGLVIEDLGGVNATLLQGEEPPTSAIQTVNLRRLVRTSAGIKVGQTVMLGQVTIMVRPAQAIENFEQADHESGPASVSGVVVRDANMRAVYTQADRGAASDITVLILGETGAGKEVLARRVHARSARSTKPFMSINCAALSETLLEGELFGYEKGAFTGALQARPGLFEAADTGSVFLDEIGEIGLPTQAKLLRVLEERTVMRLGARTSKKINVRFIAATNRDLRKEVEAGRFRQDLFFRLDGLTLTLPPLRERPGEIEALVQYFLSACSRQMARSEPRVSAAVLDLLKSYAWPGNVRELRNVVERAVVLCMGPSIELEHLPQSVLSTTERAPSGPPVRPISGTSSAPPTAPGSTTAPGTSAPRLKNELRALEKLRVLEALERCGGNQTRAAELLGVSRRTLVSWLGEFGIARPRKPAGGSGNG